MTAPSQQQPPPVVVTPFSLRRILLVVGAVLFALAAFSAGGDALGHVPAWSWAFGALGAWCSSGAVP